MRLLPILILVLFMSLDGSAQALVAPPDAEERIEAAFADFTQRAIEVLAVSKSSRERWTAAWMLLGEATRASGDESLAASLRSQADALFEKALADAKDDPLVLSWALLDPPVAAGANALDVATARLGILERLRKLEPDNAMVWVASMPEFGNPDAHPEGQALLKKAAGATRFDAHFGDSLRTLVRAYRRIPPPQNWPETYGLAGWEGMRADDLPAVMAVGVAKAVTMPYLADVNAWCIEARAHPWLAECRSLATLMAARGDALVVKSLGISLLAKLSDPGDAEAERIATLRRNLAWLAEMGMQKVGPGQPLSFRDWQQAWTADGATEESVGRALLELQGLPKTAPADYVAPWDRKPTDAK